MRTITIRQLSVNLFKELEDLPVTVTRYGEPYCVITGPIHGDVPTGTPVPDVTVLEREPVDPNIQPAWRPSDEQFHKCDAPNCKSMEAVQVKGLGYTDEGEVSYVRYLCEAHIKAAKKSGEEITEV